MSEEAGAAARRPDEDGPVIPDRSVDDEDVGWGDEDSSRRRGAGDSNDERLRRERPPHW